MSEIFLKIINMSISASYIVLAVMLLRLLFRKAPKWISVILWGIVGLRLVCPFSIESVLSLIPNAEVVSPEIMLDRTPEINTGIPIVNQVVNPVISTSFAPNPGTSANPLQLWIPTFAVIWIAGMAALLAYTFISYARLRGRVRTAVRLRDNIYQSENVISPFVLGIIKPRIYLPFDISERDREHVIAHELAHISRKDHFWKPIGFLLLTFYWINPLLWLGYVLLCRDIELACDEKVIKKLESDERADYSQALLSCSVNRRMISACPLAFGEVGVKNRVKSVLNYKKPAFWSLIAAVLASVVVAVCFLTNPVQKDDGGYAVSPHGEIYTDCEGVYVTVKSTDINAGGYTVFNLIWNNETDSDVTYGEIYSIEYKEGDEWVDTSNGELYFNTIGYMLRAGDTANRSYSTQRFDVSREGKYRIILPFTLDSDSEYKQYHTWVEFTVSGESGSENLIYAVIPPADISDRISYIYVQDFGCDVKDVSIEFQKAYVENGEIIFDIYWKNEGTSNVDIGPDFEVYKYNGSSLEKMDSKGVWLTYRRILAGKGMNVAGDNITAKFEFEDTVSYYLSEHYDVLNPGKYRFEAHGAWVEFQIVEDPSSDPIGYDSAVFDVDGDGDDEICSMRPGNTSGLFTFIFSVRDKKTGDTECETVIYYHKVSALSFEKGSDKITRVKAVTLLEPSETHLYDISIKDGNVYLTENGVSIPDMGHENTSGISIIYDSPIYSYVMSPSEVPRVAIENGVLYSLGESGKERLCEVRKVNIDRIGFDSLIKKYDGFDHSTLAMELCENNSVTYEPIREEFANGIDIYYVMEQKSGETLIVYGHYEDGEKKSEIRFIYSIAP